MKRYTALFLALTLVFVPAAVPVSSAGDAFVPTTGWDMMGRMGLGINIGNTLEAWIFGKQDDGTYLTMGLESETSWGSAKIEQWQFKAIAKKGFGNVRIPVSWQPHLDKDYNIDKAWMDRVRQAVDWALAEGLVVTLNMHHEQLFYDFLGDGNYSEAKRYLTAVWAQIAEQFKDYPESLIFEPINEPRPGGTGWYWDYKIFEKEISALCELTNKLSQDALELIRGSGGNNGRRIVALTITQADPNLIYLYKHPADDPYTMLSVFYYPGAYEQNALSQIKTALDNGIPVLIKETSPLDSEGVEPALSWSESIYAGLAGLDAVPMWWNCAGDAPSELFDRFSNKWNEPLTEVFFKAYGKIPGPDYAGSLPSPFPCVFEGPYKEKEFNFLWGIPKQLALQAERIVVEITEPVGGYGYSFAYWDKDWLQFDKGHARITEEAGRLIFDLRGLTGRNAGFAVWGDGGASKIKRIYLDTWAGSEAPNLDTAAAWAQDALNAAYRAELIPASLLDKYTQTITRGEYCAVTVALYEALTGTEITERRAFPDDGGDENIQKLYGLGIVSGSGGLFVPGGEFSRAEVAVMTAKLLEELGYPLPGAEPAFADNSEIPPWALAAAGQVQAAKLMEGVSGNRFGAAARFDRQSAVMLSLKLYNAYK